MVKNQVFMAFRRQNHSRITKLEVVLTHSALLVLEDGTVFKGVSIGAEGCSVGEVVFNTSMTGYQEILTDPSYCRQIVTLTYPHIGNYGTNAEDVEAARVFAAGLVIQNLPLLASNFRSEQSLQDYLRSTGTVAIANIDTRRLTRHLRLHGAQKLPVQHCPHSLAGKRVGAAPVRAPPG